jgi:hypothetical protein
VLCMHILHNTINNRCQLDRKTAKTTHTREDENRRHRIRNRKPRRPAAIRCGQNTLRSNRKTQRHTLNGASSAAAQSRNMQRRNPKTMGRKLVRPAQRLKRSPQRNGKKRLPLRPHSRSPRTNRLSERRHTHARRQTTPIPIRPKTTPTITILIQIHQILIETKKKAQSIYKKGVGFSEQLVKVCLKLSVLLLLFRLYIVPLYKGL